MMSLLPPPPISILLFVIILFAFTPPTTLAKFKDVSARPKCANSSTNDNATRGPSTFPLTALRQKMKDAALDAYVIPGVDQHNSEYIGPTDKRREWVTKFTGSSGTAIVTLTEAVLWTDGRYLLQAEDELDCNWGILEMEPSVWDWIGEWLQKEEKTNNNKEAPRIGADPKLFSKKHWEVGAKNPAVTKANATLVAVDEDLVDQIWPKDERPARPTNADIEIQTLKYAGVSWEEKVTHVRSKMAKVDAETMLILDLMEIAWLLNLRSRIDIPYNPVFYAFLILPRAADEPLRLFVGVGRMTEEIKKHLKPNCVGQKFEYYVDDEAIKQEFCPTANVVIEEYASFYEQVEKLVDDDDDKKFWFSSDANYKVFTTIPTSRQILNPPTPMRLLKAVKNPTERQGMINAHIKDAVALISFAADLEERIAADGGGIKITEVDVANDLKKFRLKEVDSRGESFPTISGYEANGAIIHYDPTKNAEPAVIGAGMLLIDSGEQYLDGTTDVTRTFHYGMPTAYEKESYTRVLMGQVDLAMAIFPEGAMTGNGLQMLARSPLWRRGMEYHHGTGHGIGSFLSVHEPPNLGKETMKAGLFFSDEPGYYVPHKFGIRLENICFTKVVELPYEEEDQKFLAIETVTLVPYEPKLIIVDLLNNRQRKWLNDYHAKCEEIVGNELKKRKASAVAFEWLVERTKPIPLLREDDEGGNGAERFIGQISPMALIVSCFFFSLMQW